MGILCWNNSLGPGTQSPVPAAGWALSPQSPAGPGRRPGPRSPVPLQIAWTGAVLQSRCRLSVAWPVPPYMVHSTVQCKSVHITLAALIQLHTTDYRTETQKITETQMTHDG